AYPAGTPLISAPLTRSEMAVFIIRAKMNNVFPTTLGGAPIVDLQKNEPTLQQFIDKMRDLRTANGTPPPSPWPTTSGAQTANADTNSYLGRSEFINPGSLVFLSPDSVLTPGQKAGLIDFSASLPSLIQTGNSIPPAALPYVSTYVTDTITKGNL